MKRVVLALMICMLLFSGCGAADKTVQMEEYRVKVSGFYDRLEEYNNTFTAIDPSSETASQEVLQVIDEMTRDLNDAAQLEAPDEFVNAQDMLKEASKRMNDAQKDFHEAFEGEYQQQAFERAYSEYSSANEYIGYAVTFFHGEIPEGFVLTGTDEAEETDETAGD